MRASQELLALKIYRFLIQLENKHLSNRWLQALEGEKVEPGVKYLRFAIKRVKNISNPPPHWF